MSPCCLLDSNPSTGTSISSPHLGCPLSDTNKQKRSTGFFLSHWVAAALGIESVPAPQSIPRPWDNPLFWNICRHDSDLVLGPSDTSWLFWGTKNPTPFLGQFHVGRLKGRYLLLLLKYWHTYVLYPYMHILHISICIFYTYVGLYDLVCHSRKT